MKGKYLKHPAACVVGWHKMALECVGFDPACFKDVKTPRMRFGANRNLRVQAEKIMVMEKAGLQ